MNNKGYSLVELIVTITIMAILLLSIFQGIHMMNYAKASKCINEIDLSLDKLKTYTMSNGKDYISLIIEQDSIGDYYLSIRKSNTRIEYENLNDGLLIQRPKKIASTKLTLSFLKDGDLGDTLISSSSPLIIRLNRTSGAFETLYTKIKVVDNKNEIELVMVTKTGKHYIK